jgi:hypothetical protein
LLLPNAAILHAFITLCSDNDFRGTIERPMRSMSSVTEPARVTPGSDLWIPTLSRVKNGEGNMVRLRKNAMILGAVLILAVCASPAPAAKGGKKSGERQVRGTVVSVHRGNNGGGGTMTVRVTHHKRKKGQNVAKQGNGKKGMTQKTFNIDRRTRVQGGTNGKQNNLGALRAGERVTVFEHGRHADKVVIHQTKNGKRASRVKYHRNPNGQRVASQGTPHRASVPQHTSGTPHKAVTTPIQVQHAKSAAAGTLKIRRAPAVELKSTRRAAIAARRPQT